MGPNYNLVKNDKIVINPATTEAIEKIGTGTDLEFQEIWNVLKISFNKFKNNHLKKYNQSLMSSDRQYIYQEKYPHYNCKKVCNRDPTQLHIIKFFLLEGKEKGEFDTREPLP